MLSVSKYSRSITMLTRTSTTAAASLRWLSVLSSQIQQQQLPRTLQLSLARSFKTASSGQQHSVAEAATVSETLEPESFATAKPSSSIPGPRRFPIIGTMLSLVLDPDFDNKRIHLFWLKMTKIYGHISRHHFPGMPPMVTVTRADDVEALLRATMDNPLRQGFESLKRVREAAVDDYFNKKSGILIENGDEWWRVRSRVQTPMMKPKVVRSYLGSMDKIALNFMDRIALLQEKHGEMPEDFQFELYKWALESVGFVALNRRLGCLEPNISSDSEPVRLINLVNELFDTLNETEMNIHWWKLYPTPTFKKLKRIHHDFLRIVDQNIRQTEEALLAKENQSDSEDQTLMEKLLCTPGLSRKDVVTLILDMIFAGIDTTSHTIGFTLYLLARNPEVQGRLQEEVDRVLGDHKGPLTSKHMAQMSYLKAVVKESLRLYPLAIGIFRTLEKDTVLSGYQVPKGWMVGGLNMLMGWDETYFPQAKEFIPERWLRHKPMGPVHPYASLPFSTGTRMCIGRRIAEQELYTFLFRVMHRYSVDYKYEDIDIISRLVFIPSKPLKFTFKERR